MTKQGKEPETFQYLTMMMIALCAFWIAPEFGLHGRCFRCRLSSSAAYVVNLPQRDVVAKHQLGHVYYHIAVVSATVAVEQSTCR